MSIRSQGTRPPHPSRRLGQVATRCLVPTRASQDNTYRLVQRWHRLQDDVAAIEVVFPNFYVDNAAGSRETSLGPMTKSAAIQRPDGTVQRLTFGGSATGTFTGPLGRSDPLPFAGRRGDWILVREWDHNPGGIVFTAYGGPGPGTFACPYGADAFYVANSAAAAPDYSGGGVIPNQNPGLAAGAAAIVGYTARPSVFLPGDSRQMGWRDTHDASGDLGTVARAVGPSMGYINAGVDGDSLADFLGSSGARLQLAQFCSHVVLQLGGADATGSDIAALRTRVFDLFAGKILGETTIEPKTTSSDGWTGAGQAPSSSWAAFNAGVRAGTPNVSHVFDVARSLSADDLVWRVPGYTDDGVHALQLGNVASGAQGASVAAAMARW